MSFPRYPKTKPSDVEWLGDVPEHWEISAMKRFASIRYGIGEPPRYHDSGTPLIRATNIHAGCLFAEGLVFVDPDEIPAQRIVWLAAGDIIVVRSGAYTGDSAIIPEGFGKCIAGFDMVLKCHSASSRFIQFALLSKYLKDGQIDLEKMRAAQPHLNAEELGSCLVVLPPLSEQSAIAAFLDHETGKIDVLVEEQRRLIALLKEKRQAVISHAVTKGLNPHAPLKSSGVEWLGDVPAHWEVKRLKRAITKIEQGWSPQCENGQAGDDEWGVLKVGCGNRDKFDATEQKALPLDVEPQTAYEIRSGDILMSRGNTPELVGMATFVNQVRPRLLLCDLLYRFHAQTAHADPEFIVFSLRSPNIRFQIERYATGTSASMKKIAQGTIRELITVLPPIDEQQAIVVHIHAETEKLDTLTAEAERAIELLQERRTALISAAVTGKIDVRGFHHD